MGHRGLLSLRLQHLKNRQEVIEDVVMEGKDVRVVERVRQAIAHLPDVQAMRKAVIGTSELWRRGWVRSMSW
jgi:hypothetical protein